MSDVDTVFQNFYLCIYELINKHAPLRKLTRKEIKLLSKPWVTPGIKASIGLKEKFYKRFLETRNIYFLTKYKFYRNKITQLLEVSKQNYYHNYFIANSKNIKKTWAGIKELITLKPNGFNSPSKIVVGNSVCPRFKRESEGGRSFSVSTTRLWNRIPLYIRNKPSLVGFKKAIFYFFKDSYKDLDHFTF